MGAPPTAFKVMPSMVNTLGIGRSNSTVTGGPQSIVGNGILFTPNGDLRTLPCHLSDKGGMDGFYAARLRKL